MNLIEKRLYDYFRSFIDDSPREMDLDAEFERMIYLPIIRKEDSSYERLLDDAWSDDYQLDVIIWAWKSGVSGKDAYKYLSPFFNCLQLYQIVAALIKHDYESAEQFFASSLRGPEVGHGRILFFRKEYLFDKLGKRGDDEVD